jgi:glucose/arabinose dehydrogenase
MEGGMMMLRTLIAAAVLAAAWLPAVAQQAPQRPAQPQRPAAQTPAQAPAQTQTQAQAQSQAQGAGPRSIGRFEDWEAATLNERGQQVCYAFTRAAASNPRIENRREVVLVVTHRGRSRDEVAVRAGYTFPERAEPAGTVEASGGNIALAFFTAADAAFARDRAAAVAAFERGRAFRLASPGPRGGTVTDMFSLRGFTAARRAIGEACK